MVAAKLYRPDEIPDNDKKYYLAVVVNETEQIVGASTCQDMTDEYTKIGIIRYQKVLKPKKALMGVRV